MADYSELKRKAQEIRDEVKAGANTAARVGTVLEGIVDALEAQANQDANIQESIEEIQNNTSEELKNLVVNDLTTGGADKALSAEMGKVLGEELTELEGDKQNKNAEIYENASKEFFVSDANGNVVAKIGSYGIVATTISVKCDDGIKNLIALLSAKVDKDGDKVLSDENFTSKLKSTLEGYNDSVINSKEGLYITDSEGYVAFKIETNGEVYFNGKSESGSALGLDKFELFSLGDSLSVGGVWQEEVARLTGCMFRQHINIKPGSNLSTGGTVSYQDGYDTTFWRAKNLIDGGYIKGDGENAIVVIENVNDQGSPETVFDKNAVPVIPTAPIDGYSVSTRNDVPAELRILNAVLRTYYTTSGKNLKITQLPVKDGAVTLNVSDSAVSANYNIEVKTSDSIADIIDKILEVNYAKVPDTLADDGVSVDFAGASVNLSFTDTDNTGMQVSITSTSSAKGARAAYFIGTVLEEWEDERKWVYGAELTLSQGYKTTIEMLQRAYPKLKIVIAAFPFHAVTATDYLLPNGRYDSKAYSETTRMQRMKVFREYLNQIAEYYSIPLVDVTYKCGIGINNMLSYYQATANVHPKEEGYIRFGKTVAAELMSNIK